MWKRKVNEYKIGETFMAFFLIRKVECKTTSGGSKYLDILLGDSSGEIVARMWDCSPEDETQFVNNMLVKVKGSVVDWQGKRQIKIDKIRPVQEKDGVNIKEFIPVAPYDPEEMYAELYEYTTRIENPKIREMVQLVIAESGERLITHPAAVMNHHALRSGLLYHTLTMLKAGEKLLEVYSFLNNDLVYAGIVLHDIAKLDEIDANELGIATEYTVEGQLLGHIIQGIKRIEKASRSVGLDVETSVLLEHMVLSHHYEPEFGSPKRPMIPEAELLHYLDILDARMFDMQKTLGEIQPGEFSDKLWALHNRKLYKPERKE
ncbi:MAG: HD domain-containing protein [Peptococcaceae bacterium]|nr:HD domain-containing protein [Peptococcaceae bacterium]